MVKINILAPEICNRIAAGEVVDGPYSAVKELIENSLDAGATDIEIKIEGAGKQLIQVADNGSGILKEDMRSAFISHATSKIYDVDDLDHIETLGFRGEALASIASISQCEITSVTEGREACKVYCEGMDIGKVESAVLDKGTVVKVRNLFYNTPVRAKFLRSDKKEENDITTHVTRYILGNPEVSFRYYIDGKLKLQSFGGGLEEVVAQVYGASTISQCFKINAERNGIQVSGFIGNQNYFKSNKSYQSVFLNGRNISNNCISTAISQAYAPYAMKRQYPFYVLFVRMSAGNVDVNVHPNKSDVRFTDSQLVFGTIYKIISSILDGTKNAADFVVDSKRIPEIKSTAQNGFSENVVYGGNVNLDVKKFDKIFDKITEVPEYKEGKQVKPVAEQNESKDEKTNLDAYEKYENGEENPYVNSLFTRNNIHLENKKYSVCTPNNVYKQEVTLNDLVNQGLKREQQRILFESCKYIGCIFNTYLIYEQENDVYLIDQHAAHERLIFDRLMEKVENRTVSRQCMVIPFILNVNAQENEFINANLDNLWAIGFDITPFGMYSYRITEVPADLSDINLQDFFDDLLSDINDLKQIKLTDILRDKIATTACKHAIKGGDQLTQTEIDKLFEMMKGDLGLKCPHGRPVCVKLTKREIEKMFKRIV